MSEDQKLDIEVAKFLYDIEPKAVSKAKKIEQIRLQIESLQKELDKLL